jgi:glycosyltransferase involved in cell wall biosynthesis
MKIALVSPSPLPALRYGGTERVLLWLRKGLIHRAHEVLLLAPASNDPSLKQQPWPQSRADWIHLAQSEKIHLFHFMCLPPDEFPQDELKHLVTVHGNGKLGEKFPPNTVFVSRNHAHRHNANAFVYNGLDLSEYPFHKSSISRKRKALFLAKASWSVKNLRGALRIAKQAGFHLDVAGGKRPLHPWGLFATHARFHGMINDQEKICLLAQNDVLLFPVLWHEPFGIAVIEALASGLPVVCTPYGSLPELVTSDCGLVSKSEEEIYEFLNSKLFALDPRACRARVEEMFSHLHMTDAYVTYYERILNKEVINERQPQTLPNDVKFHLDPKNIFSHL